MRTRTVERGSDRYSLLKRFTVASGVVILLIAAVNSFLMTHAITRIMLEREGEVSSDFVLNILRADGSIGFFTSPQDTVLSRRFADSTEHLMQLDEVQRINVYSTDRTVLWSTDRALTGKRFDTNPELERALGGSLVVETGRVDAGNGLEKPEHVGLRVVQKYFVETYVPVSIGAGSPVVGAVELYRVPVRLSEAISAGQGKIWMVAAAGALLLFFTLFGIVGDGDRKITAQNEKLRQAETMAMVGELAASIAHNIRNPLSSIRTTAEVGRDIVPGFAGDLDVIMGSCDRIDSWIRDLVFFSNVDSSVSARIDLAGLLHDSIEELKEEYGADAGHLRCEVSTDRCEVGVDRVLMKHVLRVLLVNAMQAAGGEGVVIARIEREGSNVIASVRDNGQGIAPEVLPRLFELFFTTKPSGLGLGLALARRVVERFGGSIRADSVPGAGSIFTISLPLV